MPWRRRIDLATDILRANLGERSLPYKLTFALTGRCNARCALCGIWRQPPNPDELSLAEITAFLTRNDHFSWIDLTGGEIVLREDVAEIVRAVLASQRRLFHLHVPCNGIDVEATARLVGVVREAAEPPPLFTLTISLDGPAALHDRLRGHAGNWESCMALYERLRPMCHGGFRLFFGFTLSHLNVGQLQATVRAAQERLPGLAIEAFHLNLAHASEHYYHNTQREWPLRMPEGFREEIAWFARSRRGFPDAVGLIEKRYLRYALRYVESGRTPVPCQAMASSIFVAADGVCYPCTLWNRPLGNLRDYDFRLPPLLAANGAARQAVREEACPRCWSPCEANPSLLARLARLP
ncbi:MAG: radical SAM protein [Magnetococcales bacterium]|nr:radical SAM protein [Magnetococcales bacterium]